MFLVLTGMQDHIMESKDLVERRREVRLKRGGFERTKLSGASPEQAITFKLAETRSELEAAFKLVYRAYVDVGLQKPNETGVRFTKYHLLPSTCVLLAIHHPELEKPVPDRNNINKHRKVVGTLTLTMDSELGLPMEDVCGKTVTSYREAGQKLAEVIGLAIHPNFRGMNITMRLFRLMSHYAKMNNINRLGAAVMPQHAAFYRDILLFNPVEKPLAYLNGNGLMVQGHFFDATNFDVIYHETYSMHEFDSNLAEFFKLGKPTVMPKNCVWNEEILHYFINLHSLNELSVSPNDLNILRKIYKLAGENFPF